MKDLSVYVLVSFIACVTPGSGVLYTVTNGLRDEEIRDRRL